MTTTAHDDATVRAAAAAVAATTGRDTHDVCIVLGSGWGVDARSPEAGLVEHPTSGLPGFFAPSVAGHHGVLRSYLAGAARVVCFAGRTHLYEGHGVASVVHPIRVAAACGVHTIILTNGCGTVHPTWPVGTVVAITDHINLTGETPLHGPVFVDMTDAYDPVLRDRVCRALPELPTGVYAQFRGPQYETPAEVHMARTLGADLVGMSTALEAIEARRLGLRVMGLSLVTNHAAGISGGALHHDEVLEAGRAARARLAGVLMHAVDIARCVD